MTWTRSVRRNGRRHKLVFLDESAVTTNMVRLYGWGPRGERIKDYQTLSSWKTYSLIAAIKSTGWAGSMLIPGAVDGDAFATYLEKCLVPTLKAGDIVLLDNVPFHHDPRVADILMGAGARVKYLPPYSPDFNPIEHAFSALKSFLRKLHERNFDALVKGIGKAQQDTARQTYANYFQACLNL